MNPGRFLAFVSAACLALNVSPTLHAQTIFTNLLPLQTGTNRFNFQFFSSRNLNQSYPAITQILISIHGISYNADDYLAYGIDSAAHCPGASNNTLVIAPCLYITPFTAPATNSTLYWLSQPSFGSRKAAYGYPAQILVNYAPYTALDALSNFILTSTNFPNLKRMIWFGNSGGGQLVNRYAACTTQDVYAVQRAIHTRYIVSAPSSYLYLNPERPATNNSGAWFVPSLTTYPDYNDWGYGLNAPYEYPDDKGPTLITNQYKRKFVIYTVGTLDNDPNDNSLDDSDAAELQGSHRVQRATNYFAYLQHFYGSNLLRFQTFCLVSNVAHDAHGILISDQGVKAVFDYESRPVDTDGDGYTDWQEWLAGTDPKNPADHPALSASRGPGNSLSLSWPTRDNRRYQVLSSTPPATNWLLRSDTTVTNSVTLTTQFPTTSNPALFRLQTSPR